MNIMKFLGVPLIILLFFSGNNVARAAVSASAAVVPNGRDFWRRHTIELAQHCSASA